MRKLMEQKANTSAIWFTGLILEIYGAIHVGKILTYYSLGFVRHPKSQIPNSFEANILKTLLINFI